MWLGKMTAPAAGCSVPFQPRQIRAKVGSVPDSHSDCCICCTTDIHKHKYLWLKATHRDHNIKHTTFCVQVYPIKTRLIVLEEGFKMMRQRQEESWRGRSLAEIRFSTETMIVKAVDFLFVAIFTQKRLHILIFKLNVVTFQMA